MPSHIKKRIKKPKPRPKPKKVTVVLVDDPLIEAVRPKGPRSMFGRMFGGMK